MRPRWLPAAVMFLAPFLLFLTNLDGTWILDDHLLLQRNPDICSFARLPDLFATRGRLWTIDDEKPPEVYRPVAMISYSLDCHGFGLRPGWFHFVNNLIHGLNVLLLWLLARRYLSPAAALISALLFGVHPMAVEAVTWISGRADLLAALFSLLTVHVLVRWTENVHGRTLRPPALLAALAVLGIFSKEIYTAVPFAAAVAVLLSGRRDRPEVRTVLTALVVMTVITAACLFWRQRIAAGPTFSFLSEQTPRNAAELLLRFISLLFVPSDSDFNFVYPRAGFEWRLHFPLLFFSALAAVASILRWRSVRPFALGTSLFLASLLPVALVLDTTGYVGERYFYLPLAGFSLAAASVGEILWRRMRLAKNGRRVLALAAAAWLILLAVTTGLRNREWRNEVRLYESSVDRVPRNHRALYRLAWHYARAGDREHEIASYRRALAVDPDHVDSLNNLGVRLTDLGRFGEAGPVFRRLLKVAPTRPKTYFNVGYFLEAQNDRVQAARWYAKAIEMDPAYSLARSALERVTASKKGP